MDNPQQNGAATASEPAISVENTSGFEPAGELILVGILELEEKTSGGIIIVDDTQYKEKLSNQTGHVIRIGPQAHKYPRVSNVKEGSLIVFAKYAGATQVGDDKRLYRLIRPDDILAVRDHAPMARPTVAMSSEKVFDINL